MQDGGLGDARGHLDRGLAEDAERRLGIEPADAVLLEQPRQRRLAQARRLGRGRRHRPQRQDPLGRDVVAQLEQLRVVAPELLADAVGQAHALLLQLLGQARPLAQLDHGRVAGLHGPEQVPVGAQPGGRDPGVAPVVLGAGDAEPVAQAVELLGVDRVHGEAAVQQRIDHRPVRHLDRHRHSAGIAGDRHQPVAECRQARAAMRELPLAGNRAAASRRQAWCFAEPQSTAANQLTASSAMVLVLPCHTSRHDACRNLYGRSRARLPTGHPPWPACRGTGPTLVLMARVHGWLLPAGRPARPAYTRTGRALPGYRCTNHGPWLRRGRDGSIGSASPRLG